MRHIHLDRARRLAATALAKGGRLKSLSHVEWDIAGKCQRPRVVEISGRAEANDQDGYVVVQRGVNTSVMITMTTKCRACEQCLRDRAAHWRLRALSEYGQAPRSWLVTLTFTPERQMLALARARRHVDAQGVDFETLRPAERFDLLHRETGREVTLFLKRLRKAGGSFRYLMVAEAHKSGNPHYHLMVHEITENSVKHSLLKASWNAGFLDAKLVTDKRQATYACKYLTKSKHARVRASLAYGAYNGLSHSSAEAPA